MVFQPLLGPFGKIPLLIRDDDTNFFTKPSMLESIYSKAWDRGIKVSFGVIPFQKGTDNISVPPETRTKNSTFPITDNDSLVEYVKSKIRNGQAEVLQHGLSHHVSDDGHWEFGGNLDIKNNIDLGKKILTQAFDNSPKFFVPPGEDITKRNIRIVIECGLVPICRRTAFDTFIQSPFFPEGIKRVATRLVADRYKDAYKSEKFTLQSLRPAVITTSKDFISWTVPLRSSRISSPASLFEISDKIIQDCYSSRSPICIINHYHFFYYDWNSSISRTELFRCWMQMVEKFQKIDFGWFATFSELYDRSIQIQHVQIAETGSKITIESKVNIKNFSVRTAHLLEPNDSVIFDKETKISTIEELIPNHKLILYEKN